MSGSVPRVSILMTVFNAAPFVGTAIDSVLAQSYHDWELVIVDDGSTDGSTAILSTYQDPRIRVTLLAQNIGRTPALRRAFAMARGTYYAVLDADDVSRKDRLARQVEYLDGHPDVVLIGSWARYIDRQGSEFGYWQPPVDAQDLREFLGWANPIVHSASMYRSAAASAAGGYPESLPYAQDCGLWLRLAEQGALAMIPDTLCDQRIVASSMTRGPRFRLDSTRDGLALALDAQQRLGLRGGAATRNRDAIMIARIKLGLALVKGGQALDGATSILLGIMTNPLGLFRNRAYRRQAIRS